MELENVLNPQQLEAATYLGGHLRIVAGAGSGKTRVLTYRIAYLIENIGVDPKSILAITFTNKAANEMRTRIENTIKTFQSGILVCTIHSLCVRILRMHIPVLNYPSSFIILDEEDQKSLLKKLYKETDIDAKEISYASCLHSISAWKNAGITPKAALMSATPWSGEKSKAIIYDAYENYCKDHFMLDFDDLIIKTVQILEDHDSIREYWQHRFEYIHVDEFQDVDFQNYRLIQLLTGENSIVCVVGDPDQTIYSFRGASIRYIMDFEKNFKGAKTIYLNENYRSTQNILNAANCLIKNNKDRLEKDLFTENESGQKIIHYCAQSDESEAQYVADMIEEIISYEDGINYKDFAILYRANYLSRQLEQTFISSKIPYRIFGGLKFFNRKEIKDVLSYLRLISTEDDLSFERIINVPSRKIGDKSVEKIRDYAKIHGCSLYEACKDYLPFIGLSKAACNQISHFVNLIESLRDPSYTLISLYDHLLVESGYMNMLQEDQEDSRIQNLNELKNSISQYINSNPDGKLEDYLQEIALYTNQDVDDNEQYVSMMTIHMSKGLEFPYVFVIGLSENIFPSMKSIDESGDTGVEEERRLAYVAFTRAKKQLFLCESQGYSFVANGQKVKSRFISEIKDDYISHEGRKETYQHESYIPKPVSTKSTFETEEFDVQWRVGELVMHDIFGKGVIIKVEPKIIQIAFSMPYGVKSLLANHPAIKKLLN